jgi:hypothetical protein
LFRIVKFGGSPRSICGPCTWPVKLFLHVARALMVRGQP